jgi:hypothetical protein
MNTTDIETLAVSAMGLAQVAFDINITRTTSPFSKDEVVYVGFVSPGIRIPFRPHS